jgi:hypothetical protein
MMQLLQWVVLMLQLPSRLRRRLLPLQQASSSYLCQLSSGQLLLLLQIQSSGGMQQQQHPWMSMLVVAWQHLQQLVMLYRQRSRCHLQCHSSQICNNSSSSSRVHLHYHCARLEMHH